MDLRSKAQELEIDGSEYLALLRLFVSHSAADIAELEQAVLSGDFSSIERAAHSIKGVAGNLNLLELYDSAAVITDKARAHTLEGVQDRVQEIRFAIREIEQSLGEQEAG